MIQPAPGTLPYQVQTEYAWYADGSGVTVQPLKASEPRKLGVKSVWVLVPNGDALEIRKKP